MSRVETHTELNTIEAPSLAGQIVQSGAALQQVRTQYVTAIQVQQPRNLAAVERRSLQEAALLGEDAYYAWGAGKNRIEGPSKHLAMALGRNWGNAAVELGAIQETADAWIFTASFIDLETGFTISRQFRQSKRWTIYGNFDGERKEDIRFQIGQTKAVRNVILNALPTWLVDKALDVAKGGVRESLNKRIAKEGLPALQQAAIGKLEKLGVSKDDVLRVFDRATVAGLTVEDLVLLSGNIKALETGADTIESMFPPDKQIRERGTLTPEALSESEQPNRGHGQEGFPPAPKRSRTVAEAFAADAAEAGTP